VTGEGKRYGSDRTVAHLRSPTLFCEWIKGMHPEAFPFPILSSSQHIFLGEELVAMVVVTCHTQVLAVF
jgi:hypothetical protein